MPPRIAQSGDRKMTRPTKPRIALGCALLLAVALAACGNSEPIEVDEISRPDELPAGSGLLSKEEGELVYEL